MAGKRLGDEAGCIRRKINDAGVAGESKSRAVAWQIKNWRGVVVSRVLPLNRGADIDYAAFRRYGMIGRSQRHAVGSQAQGFELRQVQAALRNIPAGMGVYQRSRTLQQH